MSDSQTSGVKPGGGLRIGGGFELALWAQAESVFAPAVPVNLSLADVCFCTPLPIGPGCEHKVRLLLPGASGEEAEATPQSLELTVRVERVLPIVGDRRVCSGPFVDAGIEATATLERFIAQLAREVASCLGAFPLFASFGRGELIELAQAVTPVHLKKRQVLFVEGGEEPDRSGLFIVRRGTVKIFKGYDASVRDRTLAVLTPGEVFGEMGLIQPGPHTGSAIALVDTDLLLIHTLAMGDLATRAPSVALKLTELIARVLARRLSRTTDRLFNFKPLAV